MCRDAFRRYLPAAPASALDIGCGTGQYLDALAETVAECWGVDLLDTNVAYARATRPRLHVVQGDMRTVRLGRTFDLVTSFGNALSYALTDDDVARTMDTYAAHAHAGTLLIVDALNARSYLDGDGFRERIDGRVDAPELRATSVAMHVLDRRARILKRTRVWRIPGEARRRGLCGVPAALSRRAGARPRRGGIRDAGALRQPRVPVVRPPRHHDRRPRPGRHAGPQALRFRPPAPVTARRLRREAPTVSAT